MGTIQNCVHFGASYFFAILDDYSRAICVYLIVEKSEFTLVLKEYFAMIRIQFNKSVKVMKSDNDREFFCSKQYFLESDILHQTTMARILQQNGRVQCKHCHILNMARALRFQGNLPKIFWGMYFDTGISH